MLVILDIDGTLANDEHRRHYLKALDGRPDWDKFFAPAEVYKDAPFAGAKRAVEEFKRLKYNIVCLTGRNEFLRDTTARWLLEQYGLDATEETLLMRPSGQMLPVTEYKAQQMQQLLAEYKARGLASFLFIEDSPKLFNIFAAEGVVLQAPGCWDVLFPVVPSEE